MALRPVRSSITSSLRPSGAIATLFALTMLLPRGAFAEGPTPGDTIDKTSWQKAEGLLPPSVLEWVKRGDYVLRTGKLDYEPKWDAAFLAASEANAGKYDVDSEGGLVAKGSDERPDHTYGFPFPEIDPNDPRAAEKIMWNRWFTVLKEGQATLEFKLHQIGPSGLEREFGIVDWELYYDGREGEPLDNPDRLESKQVWRAISPSHIEGTSGLTWRYLDNRPDSFWIYLPVMRRVRQATASNRSDPLFGSDQTPDDGYMFYGKIQSFTWKLTGEQEVLVPFNQLAENRLEPGETWEGGQEWKTAAGNASVKWGYEAGGGSAAPWAPTHVVWARRPVYLVEGMPRDSNYNSGKTILYIDKELFLTYYKVVYTRAGEYWKTVHNDVQIASSPDGSRKYLIYTSIVAKDDKIGRATNNSGPNAQNRFHFAGPFDPVMFTTAGLLRSGK